MPFESKAQQAYMYAKHPKIAKEFSSHMDKEDFENLPQKKAEGGVIENPGFSLVEEGDNHFLVRHPNGQEAPIAKSGLSEEQQNEIRGFKPIMKEGYVPELPDDFLPVPTQANLSPDVVEALRPAKQFSPEVVEALQPEVPQQEIPIESQPPVPMDSGLGGYQAGYDQKLRAMDALAAAQSRGQDQIAEAARQMQETMKATQESYAKKRADLDVETAKLENEVKNQKVDPNHFWNQQTGVKGGANKVLALLGLFLGGMSQSKTGVNPAGQMLQNAIDRDIEAQKANINQKNNLFNMNMKKYGDLAQAEQATKLDMMNMFNVQLQQIGASTQSEAVKANAALAKGQLDLEMAALKDQLAQKHALTQVTGALTQGQGVTDAMIAAMPKEVQEKAVKVVNPLIPNDPGRWMLGKTPEATKEIEKLQVSTKNIMGLIDEMLIARKEAGGGSGIFGGATALPGTWTEKKQRYDQLHSAAIEELRSLSQGARLNEGTLKYLEHIIPAPGSFKTSDEELVRAKDLLTQKLSNEIAGRVFNAPNLQPLARKAQDLKP